MRKYEKREMETDLTNVLSGNRTSYFVGFNMF